MIDAGRYGMRDATLHVYHHCVMVSSDMQGSYASDDTPCVGLQHALPSGQRADCGANSGLCAEWQKNEKQNENMCDVVYYALSCTVTG
eukprot:6476566-Amphidinium_carterae.2